MEREGTGSLASCKETEQEQEIAFESWKDTSSSKGQKSSGSSGEIFGGQQIT